MTNQSVLDIINHPKFPELIKSCKKEKGANTIIKWLSTDKNSHLEEEDIREVLENMGLYDEEEMENIMKKVNEETSQRDSHRQIKRILTKKGPMTKLEIFSYLQKQFDFRKPSIYSMIDKMVEDKEIFMSSGIYSIKPHKEGPVDLTRKTFIQGLRELSAGIDILPFDTFNEAIGGMNSTDSLLYIAPGNKGKTTFLFQTMRQCITKGLGVLFLATKEGDQLDMGATLASIEFGERYTLTGLKDLVLKSDSGDKSATDKLDKITSYFEKLHCAHYRDEALTAELIKKQVNKYKEKMGVMPQVIVFDYLKASYVAPNEKMEFGEFAIAIEEILGYCKDNGIIFITAAQDPGQTNKKDNDYDYPEAPSLYGARNAIDAFRIVFWQQGSVIDYLNHKAYNRVKVQKVKRGAIDSYIITEVDIQSLRAIKSEGPYMYNEDKGKFNEIRAQIDSGVTLDLDDIKIERKDLD